MIPRSRGISSTFNLLLLCYLFLAFTAEVFFRPEEARVPYDHFFDQNPIAALSVAFVLGALFLLGGARIFQEFWNRFLMDVFSLRAVTFQEALSIVLVLTIIIK